MRNLAGRRALVTGASGGLGRAIAERLSEEGATVAVTGRRRDALECLATEIAAQVVQCDLADRRDLERLLGVVEEMDVVALNAALPATGTLDDFTVEEIDRALDVNLRAPLLLARAAATSMAQRGRGHIVFVSSLAAKTSGQALSVYAATKLGLRGLALSLRQDLRAAGVGVSVIYPGPISDAGMWADAGLQTPMGIRARPPKAVADAVVRAIVDNRAEADVASPVLRVAALFAQLRPTWFAAFGRHAGANEYATAMTAAGRAKQ